MEYKGEVVAVEKAAQREMQYQAKGKPCSLMITENRGRQIVQVLSLIVSTINRVLVHFFSKFVCACCMLVLTVMVK